MVKRINKNNRCGKRKKCGMLDGNEKIKRMEDSSLSVTSDWIWGFSH